jgi:hypothetical protein
MLIVLRLVEQLKGYQCVGRDLIAACGTDEEVAAAFVVVRVNT